MVSTMASLPLALYYNLNLYPVVRFYENQWGENGWVYFPQDDRYYSYDIDRKSQWDTAVKVLTRDAFVRDALPRADPKLRDWFEGFSIFRDEAAWVHWRARGGEVTRFRLGEMTRTSSGRLLQERAVLTLTEALEGAPAERARWLESLD